MIRLFYINWLTLFKVTTDYIYDTQRLVFATNSQSSHSVTELVAYVCASVRLITCDDGEEREREREREREEIERAKRERRRRREIEREYTNTHKALSSCLGETLRCVYIREDLGDLFSGAQWDQFFFLPLLTWDNNLVLWFGEEGLGFICKANET